MSHFKPAADLGHFGLLHGPQPSTKHAAAAAVAHLKAV
jgi:hypothetical protein